MRRTNKPEWIYTTGGDLEGIAMGSDMCAEHEWGIDRIRRDFGCLDEKDGVERRLIHTLPADLQLISGELKSKDKKAKDPIPYDAIFLNPKESYYRQPKDWMEEMRPHTWVKDPNLLTCMWDEKTFGFAAFDEKGRKNIATMWAAFQRMDIAFWTNIGVFHIGGGLIFCIPSKVPDSDKASLLAGDLDSRKLLKAFADTGIEAELKAAEKTYFALSPRWAGSEKSTLKTKYDIVLWLNPREQRIYNSGWFTVEQLRQWIKNEGPVLKERK